MSETLPQVLREMADAIERPRATNFDAWEAGKLREAATRIDALEAVAEAVASGAFNVPRTIAAARQALATSETKGLEQQ